MSTASSRPLSIVALLAAGAAAGCKRAAPEGGITPRKMADAIHAVIEADRTVYARHVVNRLQDEEKVIEASEHWKDHKSLPLPAQMLRMGAEEAKKRGAEFSYALLSLWPVNKQNGPKTDLEKRALETVAKDPAQPFYADEPLGGKRYFAAVYADLAVAPACINCHNNHPDSPRSDFKLGDAMGGIVVRIPVD